MKKILFICHGNICRSPTAEFVMKYLIKKENLKNEYYISSAAVSSEELGHDIYGKAKAVLDRHGIPYEKRKAYQVKNSDYEKYDLFIIMDEDNRRRLLRIFGGDALNKIHLLGEYSGTYRDVYDPWYTLDFEAAYNDILAGCKGLLEQLKGK